MLQQVCENMCNYFIKERIDGSYEISDGVISLPFLQDGQRFLIDGSALNDGMYTYHVTYIDNGDDEDPVAVCSYIGDDDDAVEVGLQDETFAGTICALAVPPAVIALSSEVKAWVEKNGDAVSSPYTSENVIGVYSYTQKTGGSGAGGSVSWQDVFKDRLKRWRKVAF